jgi:hypothetical protein
MLRTAPFGCTSCCVSNVIDYLHSGEHASGLLTLILVGGCRLRAEEIPIAFPGSALNSLTVVDGQLLFLAKPVVLHLPD